MEGVHTEGGQKDRGGRQGGQREGAQGEVEELPTTNCPGQWSPDNN